MNCFKQSVLSVLLLFPLLAGAQPLDTLRSYSCEFEDSVQNLTWHMPSAQGIGHRWCIGSAVNNGGENSLYVSADKGLTASYGKQTAFVVAYTDVIMRKASEKYLLSFDWMAAGYTFLENDGLYVFWIPAVDPVTGDSIPVKSYATSAIPKAWNEYALQLNMAKGEEFLRGKSTWQAWMSQNTSQADSRLSKGGKHYRLVFAWRSGTDGPVNPAACIDNILIADARACRPPRKLNIEKHGKDSLIMSWRRDTCCQQYEVGCYSYEDSVWIINETTDTFFVHTEVPEGFCDFYVRTKCLDTITGDWFYSAKVQSSEFIYYPDNHCVDYITMTDDNCYTSKWHKDQPETQPYKTKHVTDDYHFMHEMVDNGSDEIKSRHTHHYSKMETDPRTGGRLKTVPEGELCSSRLGNWDNGGEAERAEFKFYVNAKKNPIMILKYAVVLESPGHDASRKPGDTDLEDPRFTLNILSHGQSIGDCASADFTSSWVKEGWHDTTVNVVDDKGALTTKNVVWKDWTTIGVNLRQYDGETLTIQLTTFDCSLQAHFGYAYFVLGCSSDDLDLTGESCSGNPVENFRAPDGFKYRWYKKMDETKRIESREQDFTIAPIDTNVYCVDVVFPEDSTCYFTLEASSQPHVPEAKWSWEYLPKDCQHYVKVTNKADVLHIKQWEEGGKVMRDTSFTEVDTCYWNWGGLPGQPLAPGESMVLPIETSGNYPVSLTSTYKNCEAIVLDTIRIPELDTATIVLDTLIIKGDSVLFGNVWRKETGVYDMVTQNYQGCERLNLLKLEVHDNIFVICDPDSICYQQTRWYLPYLLTGVRKGTRYSLIFDDPAIQRYDRLPIPAMGHDTLEVDLPASLQPAYYPFTLTFHDSLTGTDPKIVDWSDQYRLCVQYPSNVMTQRWNDVLAVKNADFNDGGWTFTAYQWYKDGQMIEGATGSYLYQALDSTSEYRVSLMRDSVCIFSCPFIPVLQSPEADMPTVVERGAEIQMRNRGTARWYNAEGKMIVLQSYNQSSIAVPNVQGIYLLQLTEMPATNIPQYRSQVVRILVR